MEFDDVHHHSLSFQTGYKTTRSWSSCWQGSKQGSGKSFPAAGDLFGSDDFSEEETIQCLD